MHRAFVAAYFELLELWLLSSFTCLIHKQDTEKKYVSRYYSRLISLLMFKKPQWIQITTLIQAA